MVDVWYFWDMCQNGFRKLVGSMSLFNRIHFFLCNMSCDMSQAVHAASFQSYPYSSSVEDLPISKFQNRQGFHSRKMYESSGKCRVSVSIVDCYSPCHAYLIL